MHHVNQFRCVLALAKHGHFGRAAASIGLTQSALSQNIQKIEGLYDVRLFTRDRSRIELTAYGEVVAATARAALDALSQAEREVRLLRNLETGHLVVGVDGFLGSSLLAPAIAALLRKHPDLKFTIRSGDWDSLESALRDDEIDVLFGFASEHPHPDIEIQTVKVPTPLILCSPSHELAGAETVRLAQAIDYPIASPSPPTWYVKWARQQVERFKDRPAVTEIMVLDTDNQSISKHIAKHSHAVVAALFADVRLDLDAGELVVLRLEEWPNLMFSSIATRAGRRAAPAVSMLTAEYCEVARNECELKATRPSSGSDEVAPIA